MSENLEKARLFLQITEDVLSLPGAEFFDLTLALAALLDQYEIEILAKHNLLEQIRSLKH